MDETWITTKGGDKGTTGLGNNERVPKDHPRVETYGTLDECQAHLGMARATCCDDLIRKELFDLEAALSPVMGYLALYPDLPEPDPASLEAIIDRAREVVGTTFRFVRPGDSVPGAALHQARTVARRAERSAVKLFREGTLEEKAYIYINRLSDAIYALALWTDKVDRECRKS
jgi:cob(I)alamin adenosyltransferase